MKRYRTLILVTLSLLFGLHLFRVFLPTVIWYLGKYIGAQEQALIALGVFVFALLAPLLRRIGERPALAATAGGLALVRIIIQFADQPNTQVILAGVGLALFAMFLPIWHQDRRSYSEEGGVPLTGLALPLAFIIDTASRSLLLSYDLVWRSGILENLIAAGLGVLALVLLWSELKEADQGKSAGEPPIPDALPLLSLGAFLYLAMALVFNPSALAVPTGWGDRAAHLGTNFFLALGALAGVCTTAWAGRRAWLYALLSGIVLTTSTAFIVAENPPGWLWFGLAGITLWSSLGWVLAGSSRLDHRRSGLWRTSLAVFLALVVMLVIVFVVGQYDAVEASIYAAGILGLAGVWSALSLSKIREKTPENLLSRRAVSGLIATGTCSLAALLVVTAWAATFRLPEFSADPSEGDTIRVMTYNIHQAMDADIRVDLEAIAETIESQNPDVISLNEVNRARSTNGFVDTLPLLSQRLGMPYVFGANYADGQYGNAILSRYPIIDWRNVHYRENTTEVRGLLIALIDSPGGQISVFSTHLDHIGGKNNARSAQVSEALSIISNTPRAIFLGDLNAEPDKPEIQPIYEGGFTDVLLAAGKEDVYTFWDAEPRPGRRIDYIFTTPELEVLDAWTVDSRASDHLPVVADVLTKK